LNSKLILPILQLIDIHKNFGYRTILKGVSFEMSTGTQTLLLGKNGSGKTTLLKILSGLVNSSKGKVLLNGTPTEKCPNQLRKLIGLISHSNHFYNELSAIENLRFYSRLRAVKNLKHKINSALEETGLLKVSSVPVKTYSSGMLKRLNIAKLMVYKPDILLLDEPYTGLDYDSCEFFNRFLTGFKQKGGTILMISHQIETCFECCDQILILKQGKIKDQLKASDYSCDSLVQKYKSLTV
jgi:heme exporter protein A